MIRDGKVICNYCGSIISPTPNMKIKTDYDPADMEIKYLHFCDHECKTWFIEEARNAARRILKGQASRDMAAAFKTREIEAMGLKQGDLLNETSKQDEKAIGAGKKPGLKAV